MLEFAIGDIHGRLDLLTKAVTRCREYATEAGQEYEIICLGDYVDRGRDSKSVIEYLMNQPDIKALTGNHEHMMLKSLGKMPGKFSNIRDEVEHWTLNGGAATLRSYDATMATMTMDDYHVVIQRVVDGDHSVPESHTDWLLSLPIYYVTDHRLFVHAGVKPGEHYTLQGPDKMLWVRDVFLTAPSVNLLVDGLHVVHGHTPKHPLKRMEVVEVFEHRTNLDTGGFATGIQAIGVWDRDVPGKPIDIIYVEED